MFVKRRNVKERNTIKFSGRLIILLKLNSTQKQNTIEKARLRSELFEIYKNLNPRYFEIVISVKEAKLKTEVSDILYSSKYNLLTPY
jgi:hypothetical protein